MLVVKDPAEGSAELGYVRRALEQGELVLLPTDTVYGIAALASDAEAVERMYEVKRRPVSQPTAVVFPSVRSVRDELPELGSRASWAVAALSPGPWTLIVSNPEGRWPWLTGGTPGPIGLRVPSGAFDLPPLAATSANHAGEPTIERVQDLPPELAGALACAIDRGALPSAGASTVLDLTAWEHGEGEVHVLRDPAGRAGHALALLDAAP